MTTLSLSKILEQLTESMPLNMPSNKLNREPSKITVEASTYENGGLYIHPVRTGLTTIAQSEDDIKSLNNTGDDE